MVDGVVPVDGGADVVEDDDFALGPVVNEQGYYVGIVERNLVPGTGHSRGATRGSSGRD